MSAFLVHEEHIDLLVRFGSASRYVASWEHRDGRYVDLREIMEDGETVALDYAGRTLWLENLKSVRHRYPGDISGNRPGPVGLLDEHITGYSYHDPGVTLTPLEAIHACDCLEYQSCEHPGWKTSEARRILDALRHVACALLEGERGPWGWGPNELEARRRKFWSDTHERLTAA